MRDAAQSLTRYTHPDLDNQGGLLHWTTALLVIEGQLSFPLVEREPNQAPN